MNIRYRRFVEYNVKKLVANISRCRPDYWGLAKHISDQIQNRRNCTERIVVMLKGRFLKHVHPGINLVKICMKGRIGARILAASINLLLGRPVLEKLVRLLLEHESDNFQEDATQGKDIRFLSLMYSRTWLLRWLCLFEAKVESGKVR